MVNNILSTDLQEVTVPQSEHKLDVSHYLFLLFWLLKPFYLWDSGSMQISDFIFVISFIAWVMINRGNIVINEHNLYFIIFIACTFLINTVYMLVMKDLSYLISTFYYIYNFFVILVFSDFKNNKSFLKALLWASMLNLLFQLVMLSLGLGSYLWGDFRFMGTFNDPNQFSFSMFTSFLIIYILSQYFYNQDARSSRPLVLFAFFLTFFFVVRGSSTGMLLGIIVFTLMIVFSIIHLEKTPVYVFLKFVVSLLIVGVFVLVAVIGASGPSIDISPDSDVFLFYRLTAKLNILESGGLNALLKDRGIDKLVAYPFYLIFGAGEGSFLQRFPESVYEVHSTFPGILFYYGLIPFIILVTWIWKHIRTISLMLVPVYIALLMESLTLANQRQPAFWIIIILGSLLYTNRPMKRFKLMRKI